MEKLDSYDRLIKAFNIDKEALYEFGLRETIFPPIDLVAQNWEELSLLEGMDVMPRARLCILICISSF